VGGIFILSREMENDNSSDFCVQGVQLVILRHGESDWNSENRFTSWVDKPLTEHGRKQAQQSALLLHKAGLHFESAHCSLLQRATETLEIILENLPSPHGKVGGTDEVETSKSQRVMTKQHWRLNERHYGALIGLDKVETAQIWGEVLVKQWRRSFNLRPPPMQLSHPWYGSIYQDERYQHMDAEIPNCESLEDVVKRVIPYWNDHIVPDIKAGKRVLIVTHSNIARALVTHLEGLSADAILDLNIPNGVPVVYSFDPYNMKVLGPRRYLGDPDDVKRAIEVVASEACVGKRKRGGCER